MVIWLRKQLIRLCGYENYLLWLCRFNTWRLSLPGNYEAPFRYFVTRLPDTGWVIDMGANIGFMSIYLASRKPGLQVMAVEPIPQHCRIIEREIRRRKMHRVQVVQTAVGNYRGQGVMAIPVHEGLPMHGWAHLVEQAAQLGDTPLIAVPMQPADELVPVQADLPLVGIKIDVENAEYEALLGSRALLQQYKPMVLVELWNNDRKTACMDWMQQLGYRAYVWDGTSITPYQGQDSLDYFFIAD